MAIDFFFFDITVVYIWGKSSAEILIFLCKCCKCTYCSCVMLSDPVRGVWLSVFVRTALETTGASRNMTSAHLTVHPEEAAPAAGGGRGREGAEPGGPGRKREN